MVYNRGPLYGTSYLGQTPFPEHQKVIQDHIHDQQTQLRYCPIGLITRKGVLYLIADIHLPDGILITKDFTLVRLSSPPRPSKIYRPYVGSGYSPGLKTRIIERCMHATKGYLDIFLTIPASDYRLLSYCQWDSLTYATVILYQLSAACLISVIRRLVWPAKLHTWTIILIDIVK